VQGKKVCLCELPAVVEPATCPQALAIKAINRQLADLAKRCVRHQAPKRRLLLSCAPLARSRGQGGGGAFYA
jgi:hypothetical protein